MKHVGADNLLLYALCTAATRVESIARGGLSLLRKVLGRGAESSDKSKSEDAGFKSAGSDTRLTNGRPSTSK